MYFDQYEHALRDLADQAELNAKNHSAPTAAADWREMAKIINAAAAKLHALAERRFCRNDTFIP
jgi:hypothetical protein